MNGDIGKLEKSIFELTEAVRQLTASINASRPSANHSRMNNFHLIEGPKAVCRDANCGVINSDSTLCDHTRARYQSEYGWGEK